jgi:hypothetical protein
MDEPTAWEDINPTTALAPRPEPRRPSSVQLQPASPEEFRNELTACLALVAPVGMTEESRREWLAVAWDTLGHLPADILASGCRSARESCDHPSKIVPAVIEATKDWMQTRRNIAGAPYIPPERQIEPRPEEPMTADDIREANLLFRSLRIKTRYFDDGSARQLEPGEPDPCDSYRVAESAA